MQQGNQAQLDPAGPPPLPDALTKMSVAPRTTPAAPAAPGQPIITVMPGPEGDPDKLLARFSGFHEPLDTADFYLLNPFAGSAEGLARYRFETATNVGLAADPGEGWLELPAPVGMAGRDLLVVVNLEPGERGNLPRYTGLARVTAPPAGLLLAALDMQPGQPLRVALPAEPGATGSLRVVRVGSEREMVERRVTADAGGWFVEQVETDAWPHGTYSVSLGDHEATFGIS